MPLTVQEMLETTAYRPYDMEKLLDPQHPSFVRFDPELGYVLNDFVMRDGVADSLSVYNYYGDGGHRLMVNYADQPCRINAYGNSYTQCQQVSDGETWEEILAAHFREPIRNFGVGGYGAYQAYRRMLRVEQMKDLAAEYIIFNIWDDDHIRNLDTARWLRTGWDQRDHPWSGGDQPWPIHGFPWAHMRFDPETGEWNEYDGACDSEEDLRKLADKDHYVEMFKDDEIVHLYCLRQGGVAPTGRLQAIADGLGIDVDLSDEKNRVAEADKLHLAYGMKSSFHMLDKMRDWAKANDRKILVVLSYGPPNVMSHIKNGDRPDQELIDYLEQHDLPYADCLTKAGEDYKRFNLSPEDYLGQYYIPAAGAAVFGHYSPKGNHWFGWSFKPELVEWLDPKPPAYKPEQ